MNILLFFDFLYFSIYDFYAEDNEQGASSSAQAIVGGLLALNMLTVFMLLTLVEKRLLTAAIPVAIVLAILFQVLPYLRYTYKSNHGVEVIEKKWLALHGSARSRILLFLWLYGIVSVCMAGLAIYLGNQQAATPAPYISQST